MLFCSEDTILGFLALLRYGKGTVLIDRGNVCPLIYVESEGSHDIVNLALVEPRRTNWQHRPRKVEQFITIMSLRAKIFANENWMMTQDMM